ncbi:tRNA pseudouridine(38-40) synthase TruA [Caldalkalibacillus salinus]|uniref:tRNA pseudouridine(38-40) synthase TruA n=1 Tax=Caldalkalibacillus salinus TaxID=2803787 RepID=UPI0019238754|nr:tRNA pseudouridine(38-40) synthase TruA [Caldalkalibacillus salinus]
MAIVAYDGTAYHGFQTQPNVPTVQDSIEKALTRMHKRSVPIVGSGRTDAGVHARGQVFHFDSPLTLTPTQWVKAMNAQLDEAIRVQQVSAVSEDFHARYHVEQKEYRYFLYRATELDPFQRHYAVRVQPDIHIAKMEEAAQRLLGTHDFTAFSSAKSDVEDKVRTLYRLELVEEGDRVTVVCAGNGFLYNMVRIIVGTLIEIGAGKRALEDIDKALTQQDRRAAGRTAPAHGLFLWKVTYSETLINRGKLTRI